MHTRMRKQVCMYETRANSGREGIYLLGEDEREKRRSGNGVEKEREKNRIRIHIGTLNVYVENGRILHLCKVFIGRKRGKTRRSIPKSTERFPPLASTIQSELRFRVSSVAFMSVRSRPMLGVVRLSIRRLARVSFMPRRVSRRACRTGACARRKIFEEIVCPVSL